jgi:hypothetical protein
MESLEQKSILPTQAAKAALRAAFWRSWQSGGLFVAVCLKGRGSDRASFEFSPDFASKTDKLLAINPYRL